MHSLSFSFFLSPPLLALQEKLQKERWGEWTNSTSWSLLQGKWPSTRWPDISPGGNTPGSFLQLSKWPEKQSGALCHGKTSNPEVPFQSSLSVVSVGQGGAPGHLLYVPIWIGLQVMVCGHSQTRPDQTRGSIWSEPISSLCPSHTNSNFLQGEEWTGQQIYACHW